MSHTTITLTFRFPMGHRILGLDGAGAKCANIHGHNWSADIELPNSDPYQPLEFGWVKQRLDNWIDTHLDHGFMVAEDDPFRLYLEDQKLKHYTVGCPPTTECLAQTLADACETRVGRTPLCVHVLEGYRNAATWYDR